MKKIAAVLGLIFVIIGTPILFWQLGAYKLFVDIDPLLQYVIIGIFLFPLAVLFIGLILLVLHQKEYIYAADLLSDDSVEEISTPYMHQSIGFLVALLQDYSQGSLTVPDMYSPHFRGEFNDQLSEYVPFRAQGYTIHFEFYHNETHNVHTVQLLTESEVIVEIDGIFNYYMAREKKMYAVPDVQTHEAIVRQPARVRLRIARDELTGRLQLVGFWENITGLNLGLATH